MCLFKYLSTYELTPYTDFYTIRLVPNLPKRQYWVRRRASVRGGNWNAYTRNDKFNFGILVTCIFVNI